MSPTQPPQNKIGAVRSSVTTPSAAKQRLAAASQRIEHLNVPGADGTEFGLPYDAGMQMGSSVTEIMMGPPQGNGLGAGDSSFKMTGDMDKQTNPFFQEDIMSQDNGQQSRSFEPLGEVVAFKKGRSFAKGGSLVKALAFVNTCSFGEIVAFEEGRVFEKACIEAMAIIRQLALKNTGDDGDEFEMPYDLEMQTSPPLQNTIYAAGSNHDSQDEHSLSPIERFMSEPIFPHIGPFDTSFNPPFFEGPKRAQLQSMDASASLLPTVAAPESLVGVSTVSKYTFLGQTINGHSYIAAADVRAQILNAPAPSKKTKYPFGYSDREGVAPELPRPLLHIPIVPGQKEGFRDGVDDPDVLRAIYPKDRANKGAVLARHDPEKGRTASGSGVMIRCNYHAARHRRHRRRKETEKDGA